MASGSGRRVLLVFVDGIGIGRPGAPNPFDGAPVHLLAPLGGGAVDPRAAFAAIDATLGYPGLPQSATGQAALFTGEDAVAIAGGHREGFPTRAIASLVLRASVFAQARSEGKEVAFLNAFEPAHALRITRMARGDEPPARRVRPSASALAALAGGGSLRTFDDARAGRAVSFDFTGDLCRAWGLDAPRRTIAEAARTVADAAAEVDFALFETFVTDKAGHAQDMTWARAEIDRLERFLSALLDAVDLRSQLVVITSDHGNLEDLSTPSHTRAQVPLLVGGPGSASFVRTIRSLRDVAPAMLQALA
jgi:2,3-bisphosphoglycerate-independent phosphoglycerate mutase